MLTLQRFYKYILRFDHQLFLQFHNFWALKHSLWKHNHRTSGHCVSRVMFFKARFPIHIFNFYTFQLANNFRYASVHPYADDSRLSHKTILPEHIVDANDDIISDFVIFPKHLVSWLLSRVKPDLGGKFFLLSVTSSGSINGVSHYHTWLDREMLNFGLCWSIMIFGLWITSNLH